ncbi:MAG: hypothetical protein H0X51_06905 [Parachlamydiaceae bacterium]|nr:hypothetical protein [Parachlamydiaceae bacterium]
MKQFLRAIGWTIFSIAALLGVLFLYVEITSDFRLENITYEDASRYHALATSEPIPSQLTSILDQPFTYLGRGHQAFVFASADGRYVLKFFRFWRLKPWNIVSYVDFLPVVSSYEQKRLRRLTKLFTGYEVAYQKDPENTGLVYLHLGVTQHLKKKISVSDRWGFHHQINLDTVCFAIQKRGEMTKDRLRRHLDAGDITEAKKDFQRLLAMYIAQYQNGVIDQDHNLIYNTGFVGDQAIRLDIGQLKYDETVKDPVVYEKDLNIIVNKRIAYWLHRYYPQYADEILADLAVSVP